MNSVIVLWPKCGAEQFEKSIPLRFIGKRNAELGFSNDIDVLFLEGYDRLEENYRKDLQSHGMKLYDLKKIYTPLSDEYQVLNRFGDFEKKCFLRWLALKEFYAGERIIHYDGDVVFNEDPAILGKKLSGKTFVLQGCPAIMVVSNSTWYQQYQENLKMFAENIEKYSETAWEMRVGWEESVKTKWAGSRDRKIISSDQDLISHLVHTDQMIQDKPEDIIETAPEYFFFQNAICIDDANEDMPYRYKRINRIDYLNEKRVALWHIQSNFNLYLYDFIIRKKYLPIFSGTTLKYGNNRLEKNVHRIIRKIKGVSRQDVYKYFFEEHDFSEVMTDKIWWKKGVFV